MGRLTDPICGHSWYVDPGTYAGMQLRSTFTAGNKGAKYLNSGVSGEGAWIGKTMGWFTGVMLGSAFRLAFGLVLIPIQALLGLFQPKAAASETVANVGFSQGTARPHAASSSTHPMMNALLITTGVLLLGFVLANVTNNALGYGLMWVGSSAWVVADSTKLRKIKKGVPSTAVLLLGLLILWIVYFPNYLYRRLRALA